MDLDGQGGREELGRVRGEKRIILPEYILCKKIHFNKGKKYVCNYGGESDVLLNMSVVK